MTVKEIRKNAPKGATHYRVNVYYAIDHNGKWKWSNKYNRWIPFTYGNVALLKPL